jgi:hypothetical protein
VSIDFYIATPTHFYVTNLNMSNTNAADLLRWIGLDDDLWSSRRYRASSIAPLCRRRLWDIPRNHDPELPGFEEPATPGSRKVVYCGRQAGYLRERTDHLLKVCEHAMELDPDAEIYWG